MAVIDHLGNTRPGDAVWARTGFGWSAGVLTRVGKRRAYVVFPERREKRLRADLRPRDPNRHGGDKPPPRDARPDPAALAAARASALLDTEVEARLSGDGGTWVED